MVRRYNRVTPELRESILQRDGRCFLADDEGHVCRDLWGQEHAPDDLSKLTLEHVKDELTAGRRAPSDERHMLALCATANFRVPSKAVRARMRAYLQRQHALHLAAHAVADVALNGSCRFDLDMGKPCPWCAEVMTA